MVNKVKKNLVFSVISKILVFGLGLLIPRLIISSYGSEINGVLSSSGNVLTYLSLIEAGISAAAVQGLYGPIGKKDKDAISQVAVATRKTYRKYFWYFIAALFIIAFVFPLFVKSTLNYGLIFGIIAIEGVSTALTFYFASTLVVILSADGKDYVGQIIQLLIFILNSVVKIVLVTLGVNVLVLQLCYLGVNVIQISLYFFYTRRHYSWIDWKAKPNFTPLKNRKKYMLNGIAWTVFSATDTIVLSIVCGFKAVSVYAVYSLVFANLNIVIQLIYSSFYFLLGQSYKNNPEKYVEIHDSVEAFASGVSFMLLTVAFLCITPFLKVYTRGITVIQYIDKYLPMLFMLVYIFSNSRLVCGNLINISNNPKMTNVASIMEASFNIGLSFLFAYFLGISGVLFATVITLGAKTIFIIIVSNKKLLQRSPFYTFGPLLRNAIILVVFLGLYYLFGIDQNDYNLFSLVRYGFTVFSVVFLVFFAINHSCSKKFRHAIKAVFMNGEW